MDETQRPFFSTRSFVAIRLPTFVDLEHSRSSSARPQTCAQQRVTSIARSPAAACSIHRTESNDVARISLHVRAHEPSSRTLSCHSESPPFIFRESTCGSRLMARIIFRSPHPVPTRHPVTPRFDSLHGSSHYTCAGGYCPPECESPARPPPGATSRPRGDPGLVFSWGAAHPQAPGKAFAQTRRVAGPHP